MTDYQISSPRTGESRDGAGLFVKLAIMGWAACFLVLSVRLLRLTHRVTTFSCYLDAGRHWRNGEAVYRLGKGMGFVYSPLAAAYFAAYSWLPQWIGEVVWLLMSVAVLAGGAYAVMREGVFRVASDRGRAMVLILLLPLTLASLDVAQANALLAGLLLAAMALALRERWTLCVIAICVATYLKIYPVVFGLVLCVYEPRKVAWRLVAAMVGFWVVSLVLQRPRYVLMQYHDWIATRVGDDRRLYSMTHAPLDLWYLLVRLGHLPVSEGAYVALQALSGAGIAGFCLWSSGWPRERRLAGIFLLCCCWVILLGPATESYTYAILAPAVSLGLVAAFSGPASKVARGLVGLSAAMMLSAQIKSSLFSGWRNDWFNGMRPAGALLLTVFVILWLREDGMWEGSGVAAGEAAAS